MPDRRLTLLAALVVAACTAPVRQTGRAVPGDGGVVPAACPAALDVPGLLARHARAYGSRDAVARALPRSFAGEIVAGTRRGRVELVLGREGRFARTTVLGGMPSGSGVDAGGPWVLPDAGVLVRLRGDEGVDQAFDAWLQRRDYLVAFDPGRDVADCAVGAAGPQLTVRYDLPAVGSPALAFGLVDAALLSATHVDVNGHPTALGFDAWSDADPPGVRWPLATRQRDAGGETHVTWTRSVGGAECAARSPEDCLTPPRPRLAFAWPNEAPVRVPAAFFLDEVLLRAKVGGRAFWGLMDSGATVHVVDAGSPLASAFRPAATEGRSASDGNGSPAFGELPDAVELGGLVVRHFPAASVPLPSFDEFGARRPELLVGQPLFLGTAVRIDYARQEVLVSPEAATLRSERAVAVPIKVLDRSIVAEGVIDGTPGWFVLDSGDTEALDLFQDWAAAHGFPGQRPTYRFRQRAEVGDGAADELRVRPETFALGPIHLTRPLAALDTVRAPSTRIAGQVGNGVLARCAAVVFDVEHRTLWLEPPCDRDLPEDLSGWTLERSANPAHPDRPWVVSFVIPGGSADVAGVKAGDRVLELGGRPALLERSVFEAVTRQAPGTKVPVVVVRDGERTRRTLLLVRPLSR